MFGEIYLFNEKWIGLSNKEIKEAKNFADKRFEQDGAWLCKVRKAKPEKVLQDLLDGALCELAARRCLIEEFGVDPKVKPDFNLYKRGEKKGNCDIDFQYGNFFIHVKSATIASSDKYGESYILQNTDDLFDDKVKISNKHYLFFVLKNSDSQLFCPRAIASWKYINHWNLFGKMKRKEYREEKTPIYFDDISNISRSLNNLVYPTINRNNNVAV